MGLFGRFGVDCPAVCPNIEASGFISHVSFQIQQFIESFIYDFANSVSIKRNRLYRLTSIFLECEPLERYSTRNVTRFHIELRVVVIHEPCGLTGLNNAVSGIFFTRNKCPRRSTCDALCDVLLFRHETIRIRHKRLLLGLIATAPWIVAHRLSVHWHCHRLTPHFCLNYTKEKALSGRPDKA
nr:MAG TPA: hypothetical protein [Bacteriophage sp.]